MVVQLDLGVLLDIPEADHRRPLVHHVATRLTLWADDVRVDDAAVDGPRGVWSCHADRAGDELIVVTATRSEGESDTQPEMTERRSAMMSRHDNSSGVTQQRLGWGATASQTHVIAPYRRTNHSA